MARSSTLCRPRLPPLLLPHPRFPCTRREVVGEPVKLSAKLGGERTGMRVNRHFPKHSRHRRPLPSPVPREERTQPELAVVERAAASAESYARLDFHAECEAAINEQIK